MPKDIEIFIYLMIDSHGARTSVIAEEGCSKVQVSGLKSKDGNNPYFEAEVYHLPAWCESNNIELRKVSFDYEFDFLWELPMALKVAP